MGHLRPNVQLLSAVLVVFYSISLASCVSGVAEFQLYVQAFGKQYEQGQTVLDRVARAERIVVRRRMAGTSASDFNPDQAAYYIDIGDPPITASIRASLKSLKDYNDALGALASGERAEALVARAGTLTVALAGTVTALGAATGAAALVPGASQLVSQAAGAANQAVPIFQRIGAHASRESFRRQLIEAYPAMRELMLAMREGTPAMYEIMKRSYVQRGSLETPTGIPSSNVAELEKDRELLAGWVVLIDRSLAAMETAVATAMSGASPGDLAALTAASVELQVLAVQVQDIRKRP
ncbi:hypothetical protein NKH10_23885 [Mesorhizobium sp. M1340]|uniref:hypothetical protein n=1 Tax=unclassified Mesorhizobium TaxID=325217 RepID=UPI00333B26D0